MITAIKKLKANRKAFIPLSVVRHNYNIKTINYSNPRVTTPLFFIGLVLPDFKLSWVILGFYSVVKYPIKLKVLLRHKVSDIKFKFNLLLMKGGLY